jgi:hypothetical protein
MYVTVYYVKCKTKKCGETVAIEQPFAPDETWELQCRRGHTNRYECSCIEPRTAKARKRSGPKVWR